MLEFNHTKKHEEVQKTAKEKAYEHIKNLIISGQIAGGTFIQEEDISVSIGLSRTPVREAFLRLEAEHCLDLIPRRGAFVKPITAQELINIYETRRVVEIYAARKICISQNIAALSDMQNILVKMQSHIQNGDFLGHIQLDRKFHLALIKGTQNDVLIDIYKNLEARILCVAHKALTINPKRYAIIMKEHESLVLALTNYDSNEATKVLEEHLKPVFEITSVLPN